MRHKLIECLGECERAWYRPPPGFIANGPTYVGYVVLGYCSPCQDSIASARLAAGEVYGTREYDAAGTELAYAQRERSEADAYHYEPDQGTPES